MLDEGLDILDGLWSGERFSYEGEHIHIDDVTFSPTPVQEPHIPVWVVGTWPRPKSMRRVLRCYGVIPQKMDGTNEPMTPDDLRAMKAWIDERRTLETPFDLVWEDETPGDSAAAADIIRPWADAGLIWWLESIRQGPRTRNGLDGMRERIAQGSPNSSWLVLRRL
jgi:hypothetical protein